MADAPVPEATNLGLPDEEDVVAETDEQPSEGKAKKLIALAVILLAAIGGGSFAFSQFATIDSMAQSFFASDPAEDAEEPIEYGEFTQIQRLVVNPAETGGSRFLMVSIGLEVEDPAALEEIDLKDIVIRDAIIELLSAKNVETLADITQRDPIKEELRARINDILADDPINRLYFTQFMLQ